MHTCATFASHMRYVLPGNRIFYIRKEKAHRRNRNGREIKGEKQKEKWQKKRRRDSREFNGTGRRFWVGRIWVAGHESSPALTYIERVHVYTRTHQDDERECT